MSNRVFSKNKKSYKRVFKIITPRKKNILEELNLSIKRKNDDEFLSLMKSVELKGSVNSVGKIIKTKEKLKL
tara:strand:- start:173 stop:388 length:216 start_codon:yes stop_codon:yes gene_type:complete